MNADCQHRMVEGRKDPPVQRRAVEEKCRRVVEQVFSVFRFGGGSWSWNRATLDRIKGWETNCEVLIRIQKKKAKKRG